MGYLLLRRFVRRILRLYFVCRVFFYTDCNKRGQTSRLVAGSQIQTSCNFEENMFNSNLFMDFFHFRCIYFVLESSYYFIVSIGSNSFLD